MSTLYDLYLKGTTEYDYDTRIDDYNWPTIFMANLAFYFVFQYLLRTYLPEPGPKKHYIEKKKLYEYHTYYFNYTSLFHAIFGCIMGKKPTVSLINIILYRPLRYLLVWLPIQSGQPFVSNVCNDALHSLLRL